MNLHPCVSRRLGAFLVGLGMGLGLAGLALPSSAAAPVPPKVEAKAPAAGAKAFDHLSTGFALTGAHAEARCDTCHLDGRFKGTPKDCASCHVSGTPWSRANVVKPAQHVPSNLGCEACHNTRSFNGGQFSHAEVAPGSCASCHNGALATGKPSTHLPTTLSCDSCHSVNAWVPAKGIDHSAFNASTNCASCHNGSTATGKSATHMPVGATNCYACHSVTTWKPSSWNHSQTVVTAQCAACHGGAYAAIVAKPSNHVPYQLISAAASANCDACHKAGFSSFNPGQFHANVTVVNQCSSCHTGAFGGAVGKPATPIHSGPVNCEKCHNTSTWAGAGVDHSGFNASTNCASCHNGSTATGKSATHMPVGLTNCFSCHNVRAWKPSSWNHTQTVVTAQCASCHSGAFPQISAKPSNHVPYQLITASAAASCDACHKAGFATWNPGRFHLSFTVANQCSTCHTGAPSGTFGSAVGKPTTPIHSGPVNCEKCHNTTSWAGAKVDHSGFNASTNCASCHNGSTATGKPATHMPVGLTNCYACHGVSAWKPSSWNHTQTVVTAQCSACHSGAYPAITAKPSNHVPYQLITAAASANCDACHKAGFASFNPGRFHANVTVANQCSTCHTGAPGGTFGSAVGKPATPVHSGPVSCEKCHNTTTWLGAKVDHSAFNASTNCASCHNGSTATGKPATHMPVGSTNCYACHGVTLWKPSSWNHTQTVVTAQCASCHGGAYSAIVAKPSNHVPYQLISVAASANCDACHKAGFASFNPGRFHANFSVSTQCSSCHTGSYGSAVGKPANAVHVGVTVCESCHKSTSSWQNVQYTHAPGNQVGSGTCDTCHNGSTAKGKTPGHIPVQVASVKCDACHRSQVAFSQATTTNHSLLSTQPCKTCHIPAYTSQGPDAKPANHIPEAQLLNGAAMDCKSCHASTASWATERMNHNNSMGSGAGWCKACHASGMNYLGNMEHRALNHQSGRTTPLDCSQSGCHRPLGNRGKTFSSWD